jgi:hypothetical protein
VISLIAAFPGPAAFPQAAAPPGFTALFNGKDLEGWHGMGGDDPRKILDMSPEDRAKKRAASLDDVRKHWRVENGELVNDGDGLYLTTDKDYGDFELRLEYKTVALADSGIYLRGMPQVQIWDTTKEGGKWDLGADRGSGGLWNNSPGAPGKDPLVKADRPFGEWNSIRILMVGSRVTVHLNDQLVVDGAILENLWDRAVPIPARGPIELQTHGGEIRWRNVVLREIPGEEANAWLAARARQVFNGKDFTGWAGAVNEYEVKDGAIVCKPGHGGVLHTQDVYSDFIARLEIKIPPGGNNGLAIRYPGDGDPAYSGMCELQVIDNSSPKHKNLDPRQAHGSAYAMFGATPGHLRPAGEWNHQVVTVRGSTIKVELNGSVILNCDLSKVTMFMNDTPHTGKDRRSGHFGFAGHGDAVMFRNVWIERL